MTSQDSALDGIVLCVLRRVRAGEGAGAALRAAFARARALEDAHRDLVVDAVFGVLSHGRRLRHALEAAGAPTGDPAALVAWRVLSGAIAPGAARALVPAVDGDAVAAADRELARVADPVRRVGIGASLPDFVAERLVAQYGDDAEALATSLCARAPMVLRVNELRTTREEMLAALAAAGLAPRATGFAPQGIALGTRTNVFRLPAYADGRIEVQDEGSQVVAALVAPPPGGIVVDYCAGAGGKTLAIGAAMRGRGRLVALDVHDGRLAELGRRARRAGLSNVRAALLPREGAWPPEIEALASRADRVLVDVPCSGLGALRRKPEPRWRLVPDDLARLPLEQEAIARRSMRLCAPGGRLVYATCTLLAEENQRVVERLLDDPAFELVPVKEVLGGAAAAPVADPTGTFLTLLPHRHGCDGFFAAVLRRKRRAPS